MSETKQTMLNSIGLLLGAYEKLIGEQISVVISLDDDDGRQVEMVWSHMQGKFVEKAKSGAV